MESTRYRYPINSSERGFTLTEMIVVLAIIAVISVVAVSSQSQFNNSVLLTDTAYTVALSVRQAQTLGLSSRTYATTTNITNTGYGLHFESAAAYKTKYLLFADSNPAEPGSTLLGLCPGHTAPATDPTSRPGDCLYTSLDGTIQTFTFGRGYTFGKICGHLALTPATSHCIYYDGSGTSNVTAIDVTFLRPNTQTVIVATLPSGGGNEKFADLCIHIAAPGNINTAGNIYLSSVGGISVVPTCPP